MSARNLAASVRARLLTRAKETGQDFTLVLTRYAIERLLYRLGASAYADRFMLKGALLFELWYRVPHRSTRDVDLLGFGDAVTPAAGNRTIRSSCRISLRPISGCIRAIRPSRKSSRPSRSSPSRTAA